MYPDRIPLITYCCPGLFLPPDTHLPSSAMHRRAILTGIKSTCVWREIVDGAKMDYLCCAGGFSL